jgi:hypothetical protein
MSFDAAVAARQAFQKTLESGELGEDAHRAEEAEEIFSSEMGEPAKSAFETLQEIGEQHPDAFTFQAFLIYITWQQVMAEATSQSFQKGLDLCDRYLNHVKAAIDQEQLRQIRDLRRSFRNGLGLGREEPEIYDEDTVKGGD